MNESVALLMAAVLVKVTVVVKTEPALMVRSIEFGVQEILAGCCAETVAAKKPVKPMKRRKPIAKKK